MNLTSKRMLQFLSVCAGAVALTASAQTIWVSDNFEPEGDGLTNAVLGLAANRYKNFENIPYAYTNLVWTSTLGDASMIQEVEGTPYAGNSPIVAGTTQAQAVKLETEGQTLSRYVNFEDYYDGFLEQWRTRPVPIDFGSTPIYMDTLMRFTPSEDEPEIVEADVKFAVWVNATSNLVVRHRLFVTLEGDWTDPINSVFTDVVIKPEQWYRLTIKMASYWGGYMSVASIWLDGVKLSHPEGFTTDEEGGWPTEGGAFFGLTESINPYYLDTISFQGTGWVDDLVVTDTLAPFGEGTAVSLTLVFDDTIASVMSGSSSISSNGTVSAGSTLTITAADWYTIANVTSGAAGFGYTGLLGEKTSSGTVSANGEGTISITTTPYTGTWGTGKPGDTGINDISDFAAWARGNGQISEAQIAAAGVDACMDQYLLNIAAADDATIKITDVQVNQDGTVTIEVRAISENVNFNTIRGKALVYTSDDLAGQWGDWEVDLEIEPTQPKVLITMPEAAGKFIKAKIIQHPVVTP